MEKILENLLNMMEDAKTERAETKKLIETKVGRLENKVDSVVGTVEQLASKAEKHEGALTSMQEKMATMEKELENLRNRGKEAPSYREVASREVGQGVASRVRDIEVASRERASEVSGRERGGEVDSGKGLREVSGREGVRVVSGRERVGAVYGRERGGESAATACGGRWPAREEEKVKEMFREANSTLTFSPIAEEDWRQLTTQLVEEENMGLREAEKEAGNRMLEEFLAQEMLMKEEHIEDVMGQVEYLQPKMRTGWNALIVGFKGEAIVDWILRGKGKMRRGVEGANKPVVENWVPGGLYKRYNALRSVAFRLRQKDGLKTRINFGMNDFTLVTRKDSRDHWSAPVPLEAEALPDFQLSDVSAALARVQRSPTVAPGRARYGGTAARQGKRLRVASPGLSPSAKEPRVEGEEGDSLEDMEDVEGEMSTSEGEERISEQDTNVTVRKSKKNTQK